MTIFFSANPPGFFSSFDHEVPEGARPLSPQQYAALLAGQAAGFSIEPDERGEPRLVPPAPVIFDEERRVEFTAFRTLREQYLNRLAGIGIAFMLEGDTEGAQAAVGMRQGLLDLPEHADVLAAEDVPALRQAMQQRYLALVAATPERLREQFRKVDR